jgi:hypothetical protein
MRLVPLWWREELKLRNENNIGAFKQVRGQECDRSDNNSSSDAQMNRGKTSSQ